MDFKQLWTLVNHMPVSEAMATFWPDFDFWLNRLAEARALSESVAPHTHGSDLLG